MITRADDKLTLQLAGGQKADVEHWHHDVFRVRWHDRVYEFADTFATFMLDASATPKRLEMRLNRDHFEAVRK